MNQSNPYQKLHALTRYLTRVSILPLFKFFLIILFIEDIDTVWSFQPNSTRFNPNCFDPLPNPPYLFIKIVKLYYFVQKPNKASTQSHVLSCNSRLSTKAISY